MLWLLYWFVDVLNRFMFTGAKKCLHQTRGWKTVVDGVLKDVNVAFTCAGNGQTTTMNPTTMDPTTTDPTTMDPTTMDPTTMDPTTMDPTTMDPTTMDPTTMDQTTGVSSASAYGTIVGLNLVVAVLVFL